MKKARWLNTLAAIGSACLLFLFITYRVGSELTAPFNRPVPTAPTELGAEDVIIEGASGAVLSAWLAVPKNLRAAVVLLHGVRADRWAMLGRAELLLASGCACLMPDLRAHGESTGDAISYGALESKDAVAWVEYLRTRFPALRVGGIGISLGGAAFVLAGKNLDLDALVIESVFPTIEAAVRNRISIRFGPVAAGLLAPPLLWQFQPRLGIAPSELRPIEAIAS